MANLNWKPNANGSFNNAANWQEGVAPQPGDTGTLSGVGNPTVIGEQGSFLPNNFTFAWGTSQINPQQSSTSNLSLTDTTVQNSVTLNATLPGGSYQGGSTGPVIQAGLGIHGQVDLQGTINIGAGDQINGGVDASRFSNATGAFNNTGVINVTGTSQNLAQMNLNVGTQQGNSTTNAYANYGTVNINNGLFIARVADTPTSGAATGTSTFNLGNNGYLRTENDFHANTTVNFQSGNNNRFILAPNANNQIVFGGTINGFQAGDRIGVVNTAPVGSLNYDQASQSLQIFSTSGSTITTLRVAGTYTTGDFSFVQNNNPTGSFSTEYDIRTTVVPCYATGTGIRTTTGDVPVERLQIGDHVVTAAGEARPIRWIGRRTLDCTRHPRPEAVWPVRVLAHAFGPGLPARDLALSPDHAVRVTVLDDVLIPVKHLLNDATVAQVPVEEVTYWHVELDSHDILLAEGLPAESFLDTGVRAGFENGPAHMVLHPDFSPLTLDDFCLPLVQDGPIVDAVRTRLIARARAIGWTTTEESNLHAVVDGTVVQPDYEDDTACFVIPADAKSVRLVSRSFVPERVNVGSGDGRRLSVPVRSLSMVDGHGVTRSLPINSELFSDGFSFVQEADGKPWRWTTGEAVVPSALWSGCEGEVTLAVETAPDLGTLQAWVAPITQATSSITDDCTPLVA